MCHRSTPRNNNILRPRGTQSSSTISRKNETKTKRRGTGFFPKRKGGFRGSILQKLCELDKPARRQHEASTQHARPARARARTRLAAGLLGTTKTARLNAANCGAATYGFHGVLARTVNVLVF